METAKTLGDFVKAKMELETRTDERRMAWNFPSWELLEKSILRDVREFIDNDMKKISNNFEKTIIKKFTNYEF